MIDKNQHTQHLLHATATYQKMMIYIVHYVTATDALTTPISKETDGIRLMKGLQSSSKSLMSYWSGYERHGSLWRGIRSCNTLIENMDNVVDMTQEEKDSWKAEAQFLKAFYHFLLKVLWTNSNN